MIKYVALWLLSVTISSFAQVLLKKSANKTYESRLREYLNPIVIVSYGIFFLSTILTMLALRVVPYAFSPMIEGVSYILIPLFGVWMLKEKISKRRWLGFMVILLGCMIYTSGLSDSGAMKESSARLQTGTVQTEGIIQAEENQTETAQYLHERIYGGRG